MNGPADDAMKSYLDELLFEAGPELADDLELQEGPWPEMPSANEYLLVVVSGVRLAIPLTEVEQILPRFAAEQILGNDGHKLKLVDTASRILPPGHKALEQDTAAQIVVLASRSCALLCDDIESVAAIDPAEIVQRAAGTTRPWLVGTARARGCALIDVDELISSACE